MEYWTHTISLADVTYVSAYPYGYYQISYPNARFGATDWIDIWTRSWDGAWFRLAPQWDSANQTWYGIWYTYNGSIMFRSIRSMIGETIILFRVPTVFSGNARGITDFNAAEYVKSIASSKE